MGETRVTEMVREYRAYSMQLNSEVDHKAKDRILKARLACLHRLIDGRSKESVAELLHIDIDLLNQELRQDPSME